MNRCSELGWAEHAPSVIAGRLQFGDRVFVGSQSHICGASNSMTEVRRECHDDVPYVDAANVCLAAGARLCTVEEILSDETRLTGCGFGAIDFLLTFTVLRFAADLVLFYAQTPVMSGRSRGLTVQPPASRTTALPVKFLLF